MAVMTAAAWAGHTLTDVITRLHTGAWPGLASLYARYRTRTRTRTKAIRNDWIKAHQLIAKQTDSPETTSTRSLVRRSPTSGSNTHGGTCWALNLKMNPVPRPSTGGSEHGGQRSNWPRSTDTKPARSGCPAGWFCVHWAKRR